jgi:hypothetical protein
MQSRLTCCGTCRHAIQYTCTEVSEEPAVPVFEYRALGYLKEGDSSYHETSVTLYQNPRRHIPEDSTVHSYHCKNIKIRNGKYSLVS